MNKTSDKIIVSIPLYIGIATILIFWLGIFLEFACGLDTDVLIIPVPAVLFCVGFISSFVILIAKRKSIKNSKGLKTLWIIGFIIVLLSAVGLLVIFYMLTLAMAALVDRLGEALKGWLGYFYY